MFSRGDRVRPSVEAIRYACTLEEVELSLKRRGWVRAVYDTKEVSVEWEGLDYLCNLPFKLITLAND